MRERARDVEDDDLGQRKRQRREKKVREKSLIWGERFLAGLNVWIVLWLNFKIVFAKKVLAKSMNSAQDPLKKCLLLGNIDA